MSEIVKPPWAIPVRLGIGGPVIGWAEQTTAKSGDWVTTILHIEDREASMMLRVPVDGYSIEPTRE